MWSVAFLAFGMLRISSALRLHLNSDYSAVEAAAEAVDIVEQVGGEVGEKLIKNRFFFFVVTRCIVQNVMKKTSCNAKRKTPRIVKK